MDKVIVIGQPHGGLGDHLQYSTLPETGTKLGAAVYVSNRNIYSNPDVKKLVWDCNPYVKGFVDEAPTTVWDRYTGLRGGEQPDPSCPPPTPYDFKVVELAERNMFGQVFNFHPKLYYVPKKIKELSSMTVVDLNANSAHSHRAVSAMIAAYPKAVYVNCVTSKKCPNCKVPSTAQSLHTSNIFEWVDVIMSAKEFVAQNSGGTLVAAAYNKPCTVYRSVYEYTFMFDLHTYIQV